MIKKYLKVGLILLIGGLIILLGYLLYKNNTLNDDLDIAISNQKTADLENSSLKESNRVYKYTIDQLNSYNDSILQKMNEVRKELKIKSSNLTSLQYISSVSTKRDTIQFTDTIFKDKEVVLDTLIGDEWYNIKLGLKYPNIICTEPSFVSEKYIITSKKKETINSAKKFFLFRWFQKKHWVVEINVKEKNPYIQDTHSKFIEIVD